MADLRGLSLRQLRALAATVRNGSVTGAARELGVTPPAVTSQLKLLEELTGAALFDRASGGFAPTGIGRELLAAAATVEQTLDDCGERIRALRSGAAGTVIIAAVSTAKYFAPAIVAALQREIPGLRVKLVVGNRSSIIEGLARSAYDLTIMGRPPEHLPLVSEPLAEHPHILIASPDHRLRSSAAISAKELARERLLTREEGSGTRLLMERFLERLGDTYQFDVVPMGTNETIKQAVMAGLGVSIISAHTCLAELTEGRLCALDVVGMPVVREWFLVNRADRELLPVACKIKAFVLANRTRLLPRYACG
jgi:DNA-binding transcriptional LysR family regulator